MPTIPHLATLNGAALQDRDWIRKSFMLNVADIRKDFQKFATHSYADDSVVDGKLGGHLAVNAPPQNCPYADIRTGALLNDVSTDGETSDGVGRYWAEQQERNMSLIHMNFGTLRYKGMIPFFTNFYDVEAATLARTGRGTSIFFKIGWAAGTVGFIAAMVCVVPFGVAVLAGYGALFILGRPSSQYYYVQPTMSPFWDRATFIANAMTANMKLTPRIWANGGFFDKASESETPITESYREYAHRIAPTIFKKSGGADIYKICNRYARLESQRREKLLQIGTAASSPQALAQGVETFLRNREKAAEGESIDDYRERYYNSVLGDLAHAQYDPLAESAKNTDLSASPTVAAPDGSSTDQRTADQANAEGAAQSADEKNAGVAKNLQETDIKASWQRAEDGSDNYKVVGGLGPDAKSGPATQSVSSFVTDMQQGSQWVTFATQAMGTIQESFTNSTRESDISTTLNGLSNSAASARFSFSGGSTGSDAIDGVFRAVGDLFKGALTGVHLEGLLGLAGNANVSIPKHYDSSQAQFQDSTFTIELRNPYGNPLSQFINLYVPLALLMAAALPISTGTQSYTAPYFCHLIAKGRTHARTAMITSMSITRGVGNLGWNNQHQALGIDVTFTVSDMQTIMHAPIDVGFNVLKPWKLLMDDDSAFKDYLGTMASLTLADQMDGLNIRKMGINLAQKELAISSYFSKSHFSNAIANNSNLLQLVGKVMGASQGYENDRLLARP